MSTFAIVETQVLRQISTVGRLMQPSGGTPVALRRLQPQVSFQHGNSRTTRIDMFDTPLHRRQYPFLETDHFFFDIADSTSGSAPNAARVLCKTSSDHRT